MTRKIALSSILVVPYSRVLRKAVFTPNLSQSFSMRPPVVQLPRSFVADLSSTWSWAQLNLRLPITSLGNLIPTQPNELHDSTVMLMSCYVYNVGPHHCHKFAEQPFLLLSVSDLFYTIKQVWQWQLSCFTGDLPPLILSPSQYHNYTQPRGNFIPYASEDRPQYRWDASQSHFTFHFYEV